MYKKVCCTCKVAFLLIRPIVVFHRFRCCLRRLSLNDFIVVWTNCKYYRELHFWPWLNLCINLTPFLSGQLQGHYKGFAGGIRCISCLSKQQMVASCGLDKFLRIHHLHSRKLLHKVLLKLCMENSSYEAVMRRPRKGNSTSLTKKTSCHLPQLSLPGWMKLVVEISSTAGETQEQNLPKRCC